ncbi:hypothetical protein D9M73_227040 [compost metagenome]
MAAFDTANSFGIPWTPRSKSRGVMIPTTTPLSTTASASRSDFIVKPISSLISASTEVLMSLAMSQPGFATLNDSTGVMTEFALTRCNLEIPATNSAT